ncbi:MAG: hypothetical protein AB7E52_02365 [Bdellovibrionales bacterium]
MASLREKAIPLLSVALLGVAVWQMPAPATLGHQAVTRSAIHQLDTFRRAALDFGAGTNPSLDQDVSRAVANGFEIFVNGRKVASMPPLASEKGRISSSYQSLFDKVSVAINRAPSVLPSVELLEGERVLSPGRSLGVGSQIARWFHKTYASIMKVGRTPVVDFSKVVWDKLSPDKRPDHERSGVRQAYVAAR